MERSQEENRLAVVSRLLLRAFRSADAIGHSQVLRVVNIVAFDGELAPIPDIEIESIRRLVETDLAFDPCPLIREGMMAKVVYGPLRGVVGRLVRKSSHARLVLSVDSIGQAVSVEVDAADVKPY